ncbi:MAG TPA: class I SAM-dependent methyltransferase [Anaeromyxobacter sp.]
MSLWGRIFAAGYDRMMASSERAGLSQHRAELLANVAGRVLEIGGGTGANLRFYDRRVAELVITEPEEPMARRLERKLRAYAIPTRVIRAPAEQLPLESETFDCVVSTLVLCTVADPERALGEVRRVLKPTGRLLFIEHVRSDDPRLASWQDRLRGPWAWLGCGCQCNRTTVDTMRSVGLSVTDLRRAELPKALPIVKPLAIGTAARA